MERIIDCWFPQFWANVKKGILAGQTRVVLEGSGPLDVRFIADKSERRFKKQVNDLLEHNKKSGHIYIVASSQSGEGLSPKLNIFTTFDITPYKGVRDIDIAEEHPEVFAELMDNIGTICPELTAYLFTVGIEQFPDLLKVEAFKVFNEHVEAVRTKNQSEMNLSNADLNNLYA